MATIYYEPGGVNCSGTSYSRSAINAAATQALALARDRKTVGKDKYPHVYNDYEHFNFPHAKKPYLEFPILATGEVYEGGQPETDRIVIGSIDQSYDSAVYAGCITHTGEKDDGFQMCRDDTMNLRGKGDDVPHQEHHHGKRHHSHRKVLDHIEPF